MGVQNLVAVSTAAMPPEQRKKRETKKNRRETESSYTTSGISHPETAEEFLLLGFSSRCAIAGLQLGKTKVFLIKALRAQKFGKSAVTIQKIVDENGDLPLHLLLRNGEAVEQVTTFYAIILLLLAIFFFAKFKYQGKTKKHFPPSRSAELFIKPYSSIFIAAVFLASFTSGQINNANDYVSIC